VDTIRRVMQIAAALALASAFAAAFMIKDSRPSADNTRTSPTDLPPKKKTG
jgi:hypothetical protein